MIPIIQSAITSILYKKVEEAVTEHGGSARMLLKSKREPRMKIKGKRTYAGITGLAGAAVYALVQWAEVDPDAVEPIIAGVAGLISLLLAWYGRRNAGK